MTGPEHADTHAVVAARGRFALDPTGTLAQVIRDAWGAGGPVHLPPGLHAAVQAGLAWLDELGALAMPDADPGKIPDAVCDAFNNACFWKEHELAAAGELGGEDINREAIRAGLAAALRFTPQAGLGVVDVDERAVDAFWRSASYATDDAMATDALAMLPRRAVRAGLAGAARAGLTIHTFTQSSVQVWIDNTPKEPGL